MTPTSLMSPPLAGAAVRCQVAAYGTLRASAEALTAMRQKLEPPRGEPLATSVLKHLDEQTLAGLAAVYRAMQNHDRLDACFTDWGVVAAPRFLGRVALAHTLQRFAAEGAWGISPHVIPHRTLHAVSGTISLALQSHGPNFGIDGGPSGASQAVLAALSLLVGDELPGVWLLLTGWNHEPIPALAGWPQARENKEPPLLCDAVALALTTSRIPLQGLELHVVPGTVWQHNGKNNCHQPAQTMFSLETLSATLAGEDGLALPAAWRTTCGGTITLKRAGQGREDEP